MPPMVETKPFTVTCKVINEGSHNSAGTFTAVPGAIPTRGDLIELNSFAVGSVPSK